MPFARHSENQSVSGSERNATKSRERVLSDSEIPLFWAAFDELGLLEGTALKLILLLGQRPGEVCAMVREHIVDGWWTLPGRSGTGVALARYQERNVASRLAAYCGHFRCSELNETGSMFATARGKSIRRGALSKAERPSHQA